MLRYILTGICWSLMITFGFGQILLGPIENTPYIGGNQPGFVSVNSLGKQILIKNNLSASAAPTASDDSVAGYAVGSVWIDTTADRSYVCADATAATAVWLAADTSIWELPAADGTADQFLVTNGSGTLSFGGDGDVKTLSLPASTTISTFGASLVDDADAATAIATLGLDADVATFALPGSTTISVFGATVVDDADATATIATLGLDADVATLSLPASTTISVFGATLVDDADAATVIATLGLDADVATIALPASTTISTFGASLVDDADATTARATLGVGLPRGYIDGYTISNNGTDADHDIDIAVGDARNDGNTADVLLTSPLTKQIDATWAAGDAAGGLFSGTVANDTWYHVFAILKDSDNSVDVGFDTSVTAANIPAGYTKYRRIGSVLTDGSANIVAFIQNGDTFLWDVPIRDVFDTNPGTSAQLSTMSTPLGVVTEAKISAWFYDGTSSTSGQMLVTSPSQADTAPSGSVFSIRKSGAGGSISQEGSDMAILTDTSSQIRYRLSESNADIQVHIVLHGWIDPRGKN